MNLFSNRGGQESRMRCVSVQSYAVNLQTLGGKAGIRMDVPEHLRGTFKLFEAHGGKLKEQNPGGLKRSIKYDDTTMSICMDVRLPNWTMWHRISANQMRDCCKKYQQIKQWRRGADGGGCGGPTEDSSTAKQWPRTISNTGVPYR